MPLADVIGCSELVRKGGHTSPQRRALLDAVARTILVIIWHLLADRTTRYRDLGADYHANSASVSNRVSKQRRRKPGRRG